MSDTIEYAEIQVQDLNGGWFTARTVNNINYQYVRNEMNTAAGQFPGKRVKVIDGNGRLIDIL
jgi:hypothetical protein